MSLPNHFQTQIHLRWDLEEYFIPTCFDWAWRGNTRYGITSWSTTSLFYLLRPSWLLDINIIPQHSHFMGLMPLNWSSSGSSCPLVGYRSIDTVYSPESKLTRRKCLKSYQYLLGDSCPYNGRPIIRYRTSFIKCSVSNLCKSINVNVVEWSVTTYLLSCAFV